MIQDWIVRDVVLNGVVIRAIIEVNADITIDYGIVVNSASGAGDLTSVEPDPPISLCKIPAKASPINSINVLMLREPDTKNTVTAPVTATHSQ